MNKQSFALRVYNYPYEVVPRWNLDNNQFEGYDVLDEVMELFFIPTSKQLPPLVLQDMISKRLKMNKLANFSKTKTNISWYDSMMADPEYYKENKGVTFEIVMMSPDEYLTKAYNLKDRGDLTWEQYEGISVPKLIKEYTEKLKKGVEFPMLTLDYKDKAQEGRHRAIAAKAAGISEVPVLEVREYKEAKKNIKQVVNDDTWQALRESMKGTWKETPSANVKRLREYLGDNPKSDKLRRVYNYVTSFRDPSLKHPSIESLKTWTKKRIEQLDKKSILAIDAATEGTIWKWVMNSQDKVKQYYIGEGFDKKYIENLFERITIEVVPESTIDGGYAMSYQGTDFMYVTDAAFSQESVSQTLLHEYRHFIDWDFQKAVKPIKDIYKKYEKVLSKADVRKKDAYYWDLDEVNAFVETLAYGINKGMRKSDFKAMKDFENMPGEILDTYWDIAKNKMPGSVVGNIKKLAYESYWATPKGKIIYTQGIDHEDWIKSNKKEIKEEYGYDVDFTGDLLKKNWVRLNMSANPHGGTDVSLQVNNLPLPTKVIQWILKQKPKSVYLDALGTFESELTLEEFIEKYTSLDKQSSYLSYWADPKGNIFNAQGEHNAWVVNNIEMLNREYMYNLTEDVANEDYIPSVLLERGWVRLNTTRWAAGLLEVNIETESRTIPSYVKDWVIEKKPAFITISKPKYLLDQDMSVEEFTNKYGSLKKQSRYIHDGKVTKDGKKYRIRISAHQDSKVTTFPPKYNYLIQVFPIDDELGGITQWVDSIEEAKVYLKEIWGYELNKVASNHQTTCKQCNKPFDHTKVSEIRMGIVKCPNCGAAIDQEGTVLDKQFSLREPIDFAFVDKRASLEPMDAVISYSKRTEENIKNLKDANNLEYVDKEYSVGYRNPEHNCITGKFTLNTKDEVRKVLVSTYNYTEDKVIKAFELLQKHEGKELLFNKKGIFGLK